MAFEFNLQSVLRMRVIIEEREERLLQKIMVDMTRCVCEIARLDEEIQDCNDARKESVSRLLLGMNVHEQYSHMAELKSFRQELVKQVDALEDLKSAQIKVYYTARRNREVLSEIHSTQRIAYDVDVNRREQSSLDDLFLSRRSMA